jgi:acetolactate synthase-1/2/3 large subunit
MKLSDYVIEFLIAEKITHVFEVCGGAITHLLDSLYERKDISTVSMHHEQAASFAAAGYSMASGNIGVAMATSGPGATNLITGIAHCYFDSVPCLFITGQVNTYEYKFDRPVRQIGFQETDIVRIVTPVVKDALLVTDPEKIRSHLERSVYLAKSGRPGPVLLDIPMNIQRAVINPETLESFHAAPPEEAAPPVAARTIERVARLMELSSRPVVLVGGGVRSSHASEELLAFIHATRMPVVASLLGLDAFPHDDDSFVGMIGTYGNRYANLAVANADLVVVLGARLDTRQTGTRPETFARGAKIVHVDIDPTELNKSVKADIPVHSDLRAFLSALRDRVAACPRDTFGPWRTALQRLAERYPSYTAPAGDAIEPNYFMHELSKFIPGNAAICVDVGQHQMWAAQSLTIGKSRRFLTQGGMGAMGSALPTAIGASFAKPDTTIVAITGDGGFQLNIHELQTVFHHRLPIKVILINNQCYGMVRQFQEQYFNRRFQSTVSGYSCPDFQEVVSAYKIPVMKVTSPGELSTTLRAIFDTPGPIFLEVAIPQESQVVPKLSVNRPLEDQDPPLPRDELRSNMCIDILPGEES